MPTTRMATTSHPALARRTQLIQPFFVMDILAQAQQLQAQGRDIIHLEIGEPDFTTPPMIKQAAMQALRDNHTFYSASSGIPALKQAISDYYAEQFQLTIDPARIVITAGASAALFLLLSALLDTDDSLLLTDPGYPCNHHFTTWLGARVERINLDANNHFTITVESVRDAWQNNTKALLLASPANPTGRMIPNQTLAQIHEIIKQKQGILIVDEIYQGLTYTHSPQTALSIEPDIIVSNSFSKYFQMTGWRLGWCVVPQWLIKPLDILAQNLYLSPPTLAQYAALAAFDPQCLALLEQRRQIFAQRRDYLYAQLQQLGFDMGKKPDGAFYLYADCSAFSKDSLDFCQQLLQQAGVAITPGTDFGQHKAQHHVRFAYTQDMPVLREAVSRLADFLGRK